MKHGEDVVILNQRIFIEATHLSLNYVTIILIIRKYVCAANRIRLTSVDATNTAFSNEEREMFL